MLHDLISVFFPKICPGCHKSLHLREPYLCSHCLAHFPLNEDYGNESKMSRIWWGRYELRHCLHFAYFDKGGVIQNILHEIKYRGRKDLAYEMGKQFGYRIKKRLAEQSFDMIIPVPLHWKRKKKRGYNQSLEIAIGLAEILNIPYEEIIRRKKATATQTAKSRVERMQNLEGVFEFRDQTDLSQMDVLLVDDVITTGATIENMIQCLSAAKIRSLSVAALAYTR